MEEIDWDLKWPEAEAQDGVRSHPAGCPGRTVSYFMSEGASGDNSGIDEDTKFTSLIELGDRERADLWRPSDPPGRGEEAREKDVLATSFSTLPGPWNHVRKWM